MTLRELYQHYLDSPGVSTDTREPLKGKIFFALKGDRFDGNDYVREAVKKGAKLVVCQQNPFSRKHAKLIIIKDSLKILQKLARLHRQTLACPVLAITGSNGKTTTRSLIMAMLAKKYRVSGTYRNFNNHIGVPLSILSKTKDIDLMVLEMGANHVGEIAELCDIALPDHGLITNIGTAHIEGFGGLEGIKKGKSELYDFLGEHNHTAFVDGNEEHLLQLSTRVFNKIFYNQQFGHEYSALHSHFSEVKQGEHLEFQMHWRTRKEHIATKIQGLYNIKNISTAVTVAEHFAVEADDIIDVLRQFDELDNRSTLIEINDIKFIADAYNANPSSMSEALKSFADKKGSKKVVVLGDMKELGLQSAAFHQEILEEAIDLGFKELVLIGPAMATAAASLEPEKSAGITLRTYQNVDALQADDSSLITPGKEVLVKASRSMGLEALWHVPPVSEDG